MRRRLSVPLLAVMFALSASAAGAAAAPGYAPPASQDQPPIVGADVDTSSAIVVLRQQPETLYDGHIQGYEKTRPDNGKLNPNSAAAKKYLGYLKNEHSDFAAWLRKNVPSAKITSEFYTVLNAVAVKLNGAAIGKLAQNADVVSVEYNALYRPSMTQSVNIIEASGAWALAGSRNGAGKGIKVGVIDSGIDYRHPFFDPSNFQLPAGFPKCDAIDSSVGKADTACKYTTNKVIVAKAFTNKEQQNGFDAMPIPGVGDHGSHVAGTIAGVTITAPVVDGVQLSGGIMSGVAPGAWLGSYNVFPGRIENARSEDILNAVDAAVNDGMDVLNLSLGGGYHGNNDLLANGLDNAVAGGVVVAVAGGNSGPGSYTIESPGRARNVITAGASTNQHFIGQPVTTTAGTVGAAVGDFDPLDSTKTYDAVDTGSQACNGANLGDLTGKLAFVDRGTCVFAEKVGNAQAAGAVAVIVVNNVAGDPSAMATSVGFDITIPAVMVGKDDGAAMRSATKVTAGANFSEFIKPANKDILAGFSSQGPTNVDLAIKPDVTSVGVNVLSSLPCTNSGPTCTAPVWAFFSGTSMATPHLAGSAATLLSIHPTWTPAQVKSALVNTADRVVTDAQTGKNPVGPMAQGAGRENLTSAAGATVAFAPVSASFGKISSSNNTPARLTITLSNSSASSQTFALAATKFTPNGGVNGIVYAGGATSAGDGRVSFPANVTVPANGTTTVTVAVAPNLPALTIVQGWITLSGESGSYHFAYWAQVAP